jgi:hypothetical protein
VSDDGRSWLEQMLEACEGAAARLEERGDPAVESLLEDIRVLQARLQRQLDALGA